MKTADFIKLLSAPAQQIYTETNLFASVNLAQIALETGWLAFLPFDRVSGQNSFNLYGIKGHGPAGSVYAYTQEYERGNWVTVLAQFSAYSSFLQSMQERVAILTGSARYQPLFKAKNAYAQAHALQDCGWATDPFYARKLIELIDEFQLLRFDRKRKPTRYNVIVGWFQGPDQAQAAAERIQKMCGYHSIPQKA